MHATKSVQGDGLVKSNVTDRSQSNIEAAKYVYIGYLCTWNPERDNS